MLAYPAKSLCIAVSISDALDVYDFSFRVQLGGISKAGPTSSEEPREGQGPMVSSRDFQNL